MTFGAARRSDWPLDPGITYLNHGTVGVTPRRVLAAQQAIRDEIARQPSRFLLRTVSGLVGAPTGARTRVREAAAAIATFVHARPDDVVFVDNATTGANAVLQSIAFAPGDEILLTDHAYGAVANAAAFVARRHGAVVRTIRMPYPVFDRATLLDRTEAAIGPRTRLAIFDHITSESALVLPLAELAALCRDRGVLVLADGAHAPGVLPLDVPALGVDWYTANLHKWACAPQSAGFLWAAPERQPGLHPPVISWGLDKGFTAEFDWVGTRDPSAWLAAPEGLAFVTGQDWPASQAYNHDLAWRGASMLAERWGTALGFDEGAVGFMATVPMPPSLGATAADAARVRDWLLFDERIEVQIHATHDRLWARISAQVYNEWADLERLAGAVLQL
jgi:isopenicillin-N epimerase